jgi:glycosyltransferase involved in cell wall biosynthesis
MRSEEKDIKLVVAFIPALNEEEQLEKVILSMRDAYNDSYKRGWKMKIIVVDDGSTDNTREIARRVADHVVVHPVNLGLGAATRSGMQQAYEMGADIAFKMDADYQHDPLDIEKCLQPIFDDEADIVWGSRFAGSINYKMPTHRHYGNLFFSWLMRVLTYPNITDAQTGLMVFNRRYLARFKIIANYNPPQQLLIDAHGKHMRYAEVPVVFHKRTTGKSFVSFKYPFKVLPAMLRVLLYANPLKVFTPIAVFFIALAMLIGVSDLYQYFTNPEVIAFSKHPVTVMLCFTFGVQMIIFGLLADLIMSRTK